jgi:hypothetical protein
MTFVMVPRVHLENGLSMLQPSGTISAGYAKTYTISIGPAFERPRSTACGRAASALLASNLRQRGGHTRYVPRRTRSPPLRALASIFALAVWTGLKAPVTEIGHVDDGPRYYDQVQAWT